MKKAVKILGGIIGFIILLIIIASVAIMMIVDKELVETQMEKALHRHVVIEDISVSIFSVISGIEVKNVSISNYKSDAQLKALEGKAVPKGDLFASLESFRFKVQFIPLLKRKFVLKELTLNGPVINIVKSAGGQFNFSDLTRPKKLSPEEKAEREAEKKEEATKEKKEFTAADLPVEITVGKVGIERGLVNYRDQKLNQSFQVYGLRALVHDIHINPKSLKEANSLGVTIYTGLKSVGETKSGAVKSFDITFDVHGTVKPFNAANGKVDPEVSLKMGSPNGYFTGLQIFDRITENDQLNKYMGKHLDFLKGKTEWKGSEAAYVSAHYKGGAVRLSDGRINAKEVIILFEGSTNINTKAIGLKIDLELSDSRKGAIQTGIRRNIESGLKKLGVDKYVKAENITESAMRPLLNERGEVYLRFAASGTTSEPKVRLVYPTVGTIDDVIKGAGGEVTKALQQEAENRAKRAVDKAAQEAGNRAKRGAQRLLRKLF